MAYEQRDNSGSIFKNDKKTSDSHPNGTGKAMIGSVMYYVSAWTKEGAKGKFQSLSFKPVDESSSSLKPQQKSQPESDFDDLEGPPF